MHTLIDGKKVADELKEEIKKEISRLKEKLNLAVILVGENSASKVYIRIKEETCRIVGIESHVYNLSEKVLQEELLSLIDKLNKDKSVNGILVQMPLPSNIDSNLIMKAVSPQKDVDGFHSQNIGNMVMEKDALLPCTPKGIIKLFDYYKIDLASKEVVVVGKSIIVGKPVAIMLMNKGATVTVCNSKTKDLAAHTKRADIIISAVGKKNLIMSNMVKDGVIVVDVGIVREKNKLYGDVDFENVSKKASYITPVPGGVGPMTVVCLMENTLLAGKIQKNN